MTLQTRNLFENRSARILYALFLTAISLWLVNPYKFGLHDHWYMLPWLENLAQPEVFDIDPVTAQRDYHYSVLYHVLHLLPLPVYVSFLLLYTSCLAAIFYLSMAIHRLFSRQFVYLTPLLILVPWYTLGATNTIPALLLMRLSGFPFLLTGIYFWLRQKSLLAWTLVGVAFLFHPATGLYVAAFLGINLLLDANKRNSKREWLSVLAFVLLSLPVFIQKFTAQDTGFQSFWADQYWLETIRIRSAHHAFPDSWHPWHILSGIGLLSILAIGSFRVSNPFLRRFFASVVIASLVIYACGFLFTYLWPAYTGIQVQPFRVARIVMFLSLLFVPVIWLNIDKKYVWIDHLLIAGLLCGSGYLQTRFLFFYNFSLLLPLSIGYYLPNVRRYAAAFLLITAFVVLDNHQFTPLKITNELPEDEKKMYSWIRKNTPRASLWIIPADMMYFRNHAKRNALVTWWDGTFGYFDYNYNKLWRQRYEKTYGSLDYGKKEPDLKDWGELSNLVQNFEAEAVYVLKTEAVKSDKLKQIWSGGTYFIYRFTGDQ